MALEDAVIPSRVLGRSAVAATRLGLGCAPLGGLFTPVSAADARETVDAAWDAGVRCYDVAPQYGAGRAERRLGQALAARARDEYVLCTKVGRLIVPRGAGERVRHFAASEADLVFDFSRDGVRRSLESSLQRLGVDRVDVVHVHDPDDHLDQAIGEALPALCALRDEGVIGAVGAGMNQAPALERIVRETGVDCVLLAGRYTLLENEGALPLLDLCERRGVAVLAGGVLNSGVLADPGPGAMFDYAPAPGWVLARARATAAICARRGVALAAAALQFPLGHPAVAGVLVGARTGAEIRANVEHFGARLPARVWDELRDVGLIRPDVPTP